MICFEFLRILEKNRKKGKPKNLGKHGPYVALWAASLWHDRRAKKAPPSGTLRRSLATPQRSTMPRRRHCSQ